MPGIGLNILQFVDFGARQKYPFPYAYSFLFR